MGVISWDVIEGLMMESSAGGMASGGVLTVGSNYIVQFNTRQSLVRGLSLGTVPPKVGG